MNLVELNARTATQVAAEERTGRRLVKIEIFELADGSRRWASLITVQDERGDEHSVRITEPPGKNSPPWTLKFGTNWIVAVVPREDWRHA